MQYSVEYQSSRGEVWRWYWRAWSRANGLWRYHVLLAGVVAASVAYLRWNEGRSVQGAAWMSATATVTCLVLLVLWPQLRFKPQTRHLTISEAGWSSRIGQMTGTRAWREVQAIHEADGAIEILGTNQNALLVPTGAFSTEAGRREFLTAALAWYREARCQALQLGNPDSAAGTNKRRRE